MKTYNNAIYFRVSKTNRTWRTCEASSLFGSFLFSERLKKEWELFNVLLVKFPEHFKDSICFHRICTLDSYQVRLDSNQMINFLYVFFKETSELTVLCYEIQW